jgi:ribosomal protein S18 acetylase RimI-like enzyme
MSAGAPLQDVRRLLEQDRNWCAYALADLFPPYAENARWYLQEEAVILTYHGLKPPVLFAHGDPAQVETLFEDVPPGRYQYGLLASHLSRLEDRLQRSSEKSMWRMVLARDCFPGAETAVDIHLLGLADLDDILELFDTHPDQPEAFDRSQLANGKFFGIRKAGVLRAVSGTHVVSSQAGVAALGNVFTHPVWRGRGYAKRITAILLDTLLQSGIQTLVLNVSMDNQPAISMYRSLGFWPFCGYYEGVGDLARNHQARGKDP